MNGKPLTTEDIKDILNRYYNEKKSAGRISREVGRTESSIRNIVHRYKSMAPEKKKVELNAKPETIQKINELLKRDEPKEEKVANEVISPVVTPVKTNTPIEKEITPREMIKRLYDLGYRIMDNMLVVLVPQPVKLNDIING